MLLLQNKEHKNTLNLAIEAGNTRCVNLILSSLKDLSMNNVHALKTCFVELLKYVNF